jgi:hypothetical protein
VKYSSSVCKEEKFFFESDKDAWESLRKKLPSKFATLYRNETVSAPINNAKHVVEKHNAKYSEPLEGDTVDIDYWLPVMFGITDDEYNVHQLRQGFGMG